MVLRESETVCIRPGPAWISDTAFAKVSDGFAVVPLAVPNGGYGSIRARRAKEDRSFAARGRALEPRWSADPHIADTHGGTGCRAGGRLDGAGPTYAQRRWPAPYAAQPPPEKSRSSWRDLQAEAVIAAVACESATGLAGILPAWQVLINDSKLRQDMHPRGRVAPGNASRSA